MSNTTGTDLARDTAPAQDADALAERDAKRHLITALEDLRERSAEARRAGGAPETPGREKAVRRLREALRADPGLLGCVEALYADAVGGETEEEDGRDLRVARETCTMLEETVEAFEGRLLDAIAENGRLHKRIHELKGERMDLRATLASVTRQRDELRTRTEDLRHEGQAHREALSAAEREILFLNERLLRAVGSADKH